ncbi:hypothetical protein LUZ60_004481 [Juncus effusus]|nr:hypothetical protein LUZ60_004481 [Juncus effusus]
MASLKPPEHQVAGHSIAAGQLGPLIDGSGHFYKPLDPTDARSFTELAFYSSFSSLPTIPDSISAFFPSFHGTQNLNGMNHLVLDDLLSGYVSPCVIDVKIGARTWHMNDSEEYVEKCLKKDRDSTSVPLGFRISGLQVHHEHGLWKPNRNEVRKYTVSDTKRVLKQFVSSNPNQINPDRSFAASILGGSNGVLAQLKELKPWFENQTLFHFYSTSILISYEKGGKLGKIKLVDFAHVVEGEGIIDHNFLGGLCSLIKFLSDILSGSEESDEVKAANNGNI